MNRSMMKVAVTLPLLLLSLTIGCHSRKELAERQRKAQETASAKRDIAALCSRYNSVVDWPQQVRDKLYTIDIEPSLIRKDGRPCSSMECWKTFGVKAK